MSRVCVCLAKRGARKAPGWQTSCWAQQRRLVVRAYRATGFWQVDQVAGAGYAQEGAATCGLQLGLRVAMHN